MENIAHTDANVYSPCACLVPAETIFIPRYSMLLVRHGHDVTSRRSLVDRTGKKGEIVRSNDRFDRRNNIKYDQKMLSTYHVHVPTFKCKYLNKNSFFNFKQMHTTKLIANKFFIKSSIFFRGARTDMKSIEKKLTKRNLITNINRSRPRIFDTNAFCVDDNNYDITRGASVRTLYLPCSDN